MIGIDLGTTNSCVAVRDPFGGASTVRVAVGPNPPYDTVLRSVVYDPCGSALIGGNAIRRFREAPDAAPYLETFKPQFEEQRLRTTIIREKEGSVDAFGRARVGPAAWTRAEVGATWSRRELVTSAQLLAQHLLREALAAGGEPDRVLLGAPVSFSSTARKRLLCGLRNTRERDGAPIFTSWADLIERVSFVLEPVAVAAGPLREAFDVGERETVLVFDNGGGTLDLTLVEYDELQGFSRPMPVRQLSALGSDRVAGSAFDEAFYTALIAERHPAARSLGSIHQQIRLQLVEDCKIELSTRESAELFGTPVTREEFEAGVVDVVDEIEATVRRLLDTSDVTIEQIDRVIDVWRIPPASPASSSASGTSSITSTRRTSRLRSRPPASRRRSRMSLAASSTSLRKSRRRSSRPRSGMWMSSRAARTHFTARLSAERHLRGVTRGSSSYGRKCRWVKRIARPRSVSSRINSATGSCPGWPTSRRIPKVRGSG